MKESARRIRGRQYRKKAFFCLPTQCYDVPSVRSGESLFSTLAEKIDGIRGRKWNAEWVIVFQMVILKGVRHVTDAKNTRA